MGHHQSGIGPEASVLNLGAYTPSATQAHGSPPHDAAGVLRLGQVDIARPAALSALGPQVDLRPDSRTGIEHIARLQKGQLGHADASGMDEVQQHHVPFRHPPSFSGDVDQVAILSRARRCSSAGRGDHVGSLSAMAGDQGHS